MKNVASLTEANEYLTAQLAEKEQHIQQQTNSLICKEQRIKLLEETIRLLKHKQYGASSEKAAADQVTLFDEPEEDQTEVVADAITAPGHSRRAQKRASIPADLLREVIEYDLPDADKVCPLDGTALKLIGVETHEQLEFVPAQLKVIRHQRRKYACPCCEQYVVTARKPAQPIEKSIAGPGLLSHVAVSKYADALPLYRQTAMWGRTGVELDRTTLANWMVKSGELIQPLINGIQDKLHQQPVLHMDETPVQVLNEPDRTAQSKSYMWVTVSADLRQPAALYHYAPGRGGDVPRCLLEDYQGALMVDGYEGYNAVCTQRQLIRLGCWAHARRKFVEAQKAQPAGKTGKADQALALIQKLYAIEREIKYQPPDERHRIRQSQSKPVIGAIKAWLEKSLNQVPPKTALGKALHYLHNQWGRLVQYVDDGTYPIDNNRAENAIRPFVIGRKNWLFSSSQSGARASANLYSLIETAKLNDLDPWSYLKKVFTDLPNAQTAEDIEALLPWNVKSAVG